jgi:hypothetical protein
VGKFLISFSGAKPMLHSLSVRITGKTRSATSKNFILKFYSPINSYKENPPRPSFVKGECKKPPFDKGRFGGIYIISISNFYVVTQ